jgi:hypothetical protein
MPIDPVLQTDTGTVARGKINAAIVEANKVDGIETDITGKANVGGDNLTSPATWRTSLDLYSKPETNAITNAKAPVQAIRFDGSGGNMHVPGSGSFDIGSQFSVAVLFRAPATATVTTAVIKKYESSGNQRSWTLILNTSMRLTVAISPDGGSGAAGTLNAGAGTELSPGVWYWVVTTFSGGTTVIYVNGASIASGTLPTPPFAATSLIRLSDSNTGAAQGGSQLEISEAIIFNYALPATTTSGVKGIAERFRDGDWVTDADRLGGNAQLLNEASSTFESGTGGIWTNVTSSTVAVSEEQARTGTKSLKTTPSGSASGSGVRITAANLATLSTLAHRPNAYVEFEAWIYVANLFGGTLRLNWRNFADTATETQISATAGWQKLSFISSSGLSPTSTAMIYLYQASSPSSPIVFYLDDITLKVNGAILHLAPELMQPSPGQCLDASPNKLHALQSATGTSLVRPKREGRIYGYASSDGTFWITGTDRVTLPIGARITAVTVKVIGTGGDVSLWDGTTRRICAVQAVTGNRTNALTIDNDAAFCSSGKLRINHEDNIEAYWRVDYVDTEAEFN